MTTPPGIAKKKKPLPHAAERGWKRKKADNRSGPAATPEDKAEGEDPENCRVDAGLGDDFNYG